MTLSTNLVQVIRTGLLLGLAACMTLSNPSEARAQPPDSLRGPPESVEALVAQVRAGDVTWVDSFLRQMRGPRTPAALQALSDSLVGIMETPQEPGTNVHLGVLGAIGYSITAERGTAFVGGVDLLFRIYDTVDSPRIRGSILFWLNRAAPPGLILPLFAEAVESPEAHSITALRLLAEEMGPPGVAILQNAYCSDRIENPGAQRLLRGYIWSGVIDEECGLGAG